MFDSFLQSFKSLRDPRVITYELSKLYPSKLVAVVK